MNQSTESPDLFWDALDRTLANPTSSHCWHALAQRYSTTADAHARRTAVEKLLSLAAHTGVAGYLRATFLSGVAGDARYVTEAARLALELDPVDPDRLAAFACHEWIAALEHQRDRYAFVQALRDARLPEITDFLGRHLASRAGVRPAMRPVEAVTRVAVVAPYLGDAAHPPTVMAIEQANILAGSGREARVFSCQELRIPDAPSLRADAIKITLPPPDVPWWQRRIGPQWQIVLSDERYSLMRRWREMLAAMAQWDPDLVMLVGLYSPLITALHPCRPVLGLSVNTVPPVAPVDVWLTADEEQSGRPNATWEPAQPACWGWYHPFRIRHAPAGAPVPRAALGVRDDAVLLISVGARLPGEISGAWAQGMLALLARHRDAVWLLVGGKGELPPALAGAPADRVRALAHRPDLGGVLACCDIYVNPPRIGGGFSVADAMAAGLAVVSHADSDGGSKVGPEASLDDAGYFSRLGSLMRDPGLRRESGAVMRERFARVLDLARSGPGLLGACDLALQRFRQREERPG